MDLFEVFPTIISKSHYTNNEDLKKSVERIISVAEREDIQQYDHSVHYYETHGDFIEESSFLDFKNFLLTESKIYLEKVYKIKSEMLITLGWINCANAGYRLETHNHANSIISGTYFLNFNHTQHAALNFYRGNLGKNYQYFELAPSSYDRLNAKNCEFKNIIEGDLLLWPSYLEHGYSSNLTPGRTTISMNFMPTEINNGRYGFKILKL